MGDRCVKVEAFNSGHLFVVCKPLMKRIHKYIQESGELAFVDSSGGFDRDGYQVFLFVTHSKNGDVFFAHYIMKLLLMK